jgi:hypothetical protein
MTKRIVTRIGDIFSVTLDSGNLRFFQYVANDLSCLNSSVIRVFKKEYPNVYEMKPEEVVLDEVDFYAHTVLRWGIVDNGWQKAGKCKDLGDTENILFRDFSRDYILRDCLEMESDHKERIWEAWFINQEWFTIGKLTEEFRLKSDIGPVFPYTDIIARIKNGVYPGTAYWPEEH